MMFLKFRNVVLYYDLGEDVNEVTICSSSKFYGTAKELEAQLLRRGLIVNTPRFDYNEELVPVTRTQKRILTLEFFQKIQRSKCLYIVANGGYTGSSVCAELGFATALKIPILISEEPTEAVVHALVHTVIGVKHAPDFLELFLKGKR